MYTTTLFFSLCFAAHGFCDFLPLILTFDRNVFINYIFAILVFCYLHLINQSISTLIFILISSIHFSQDFAPYNEIIFPNIGLYILSGPIIIDYNVYLDYLKLLLLRSMEHKQKLETLHQIYLFQLKNIGRIKKKPLMPTKKS